MDLDRLSNLEDVAQTAPEKGLEWPIDAVGMENIETLILIRGSRIPAKAYVEVSLSKGHRGIHMSRLHQLLMELNSKELTWEALRELMQEMLSSHAGLSDLCRLQLTFELPILRKALASSAQGWRHYPIALDMKWDGITWDVGMKLSVLYSSTCPCSAALARQAIEADFETSFANEKISVKKMRLWIKERLPQVAWPHAQRSRADVELRLDQTNLNSKFEVESWIDRLETALATPVQSAVKREDEKEFARLNAQNTMFCEDAVRKLAGNLKMASGLSGFVAEVRHFESLHPHDVVARIQWQATPSIT